MPATFRNEQGNRDRVKSSNLDRSRHGLMATDHPKVNVSFAPYLPLSGEDVAWGEPWESLWAQEYQMQWAWVKRWV